MKVGDLVYYISSADGKKVYTVIKEITTSGNPIKIWGNWYHNKKEALKDKETLHLSHMYKEDCILEHTTWKKRYSK